MHKGTLIFRRPALAVATLLLALAATLAVVATTGALRAEAATTITINIKDYAYSKKSVTVKKGTIIKWVNKDSMKHDVNSKKFGGPKGPLLSKGKSYSWRAEKSGTYNYFCTPHPYMKGKIIVK